MFVVGGGCYTEYHNIRAYAGRKAANTASAGGGTRRLVYGSSELLSPQGFLSQVHTSPVPTVLEQCGPYGVHIVITSHTTCSRLCGPRGHLASTLCINKYYYTCIIAFQCCFSYGAILFQECWCLGLHTSYSYNICSHE